MLVKFLLDGEVARGGKFPLSSLHSSTQKNVRVKKAAIGLTTKKIQNP
jgi:hypothetical protein